MFRLDRVFIKVLRFLLTTWLLCLLRFVCVLVLLFKILRDEFPEEFLTSNSSYSQTVVLGAANLYLLSRVCKMVWIIDVFVAGWSSSRVPLKRFTILYRTSFVSAICLFKLSPSRPYAYLCRSLCIALHMLKNSSSICFLWCSLISDKLNASFFYFGSLIC